MDFQLPDVNIRLMAPEIFLFIWALVVITFDLVTKRRSGAAVGYLTLLGLLVAGIMVPLVGYGSGFGVMFFSDASSVFFKMIFLGAAFMAVGSSFGIIRQHIVHHRG